MLNVSSVWHCGHELDARVTAAPQIEHAAFGSVISPVASTVPIGWMLKRRAVSFASSAVRMSARESNANRSRMYTGVAGLAASRWWTSGQCSKRRAKMISDVLESAAQWSAVARSKYSRRGNPGMASSVMAPMLRPCGAVTVTSG